MLTTPRARRLTAVLAVGLSGALVLAGCRTDPSVAAYVGDSQVTNAQLGSAVDERLADPAIASFAEADRTGFTRQVLSLLVQERVYAAAADRYDIDVSDGDVEARIDQLLAGGDETAVFAQLAEQQGVSRPDVIENVRQQLISVQLAEATGAADLSDAALRDLYDQTREGSAQIELGFITVPDQPTADGVLAQLTADPASYPALAAQYPGDSTLPAVEPRAPADVPQVIAQQVAATQPGNGFTLPLDSVGGVVVVFVQGISYPTFEELEPQLQDQAAAQAAEAGAAVVSQVQDDLRVRVNPRYGVLEEGSVVADGGGVVQLLDQADDAPATADGAPAGN